MVEVDCRHRGTAFVLIMSTAAYSGLVSWLESRPHSVGAL